MTHLSSLLTFTLTLSAGLVTVALLWTIPTTTSSAPATLRVPFTDTDPDRWCTSGGACWQRAPLGVSLTAAEGTSYAALGLREGDTLTHFDSTAITGMSSMLQLHKRLQQSGSVCLGVQRAQQHLQLVLSIPGSPAPHLRPCPGTTKQGLMSSEGQKQVK